MSLSNQSPNSTVNPPWYYPSTIALLKPLCRLLVWQQSHQRHNYADEVAERFGHRYPKRPTQAERGVIWCHAVSLGETNTIAPLLDELLAAGYGIWLTNTMQMGYNRAEQRFTKARQLSHSYMPVDSKAVISSFLQHVQPVAALFVEVELWATTLAQLAQRQIPSLLVNARLSPTSYRRYQRFAKFSRVAVV